MNPFSKRAKQDLVDSVSVNFTIRLLVIRKQHL